MNDNKIGYKDYLADNTNTTPFENFVEKEFLTSKYDKLAYEIFGNAVAEKIRYFDMFSNQDELATVCIIKQCLSDEVELAVGDLYISWCDTKRTNGEEDELMTEEEFLDAFSFVAEDFGYTPEAIENIVKPYDIGEGVTIDNMFKAVMCEFEKKIFAEKTEKERVALKHNVEQER